MPSEVERVRDELAAAWGTELGRVRRLVAVLLDGDWHPVGELVAATVTSRRSVLEVLRRLGPLVELDGGGDRARAPDQAVPALAAAFQVQAGDAPPPPAEAVVAASMTAIMAGLPAPVRHLDHVPATPATAARRARFLAERFDLDGASVLCLGDHDLTSLALLQVAAGVEVAVVDVDERVLGYVDDVARARGWRVRTVFADLRVELPRSLAGRFDLVFSDPPYTQAGVRLFLRRGLEALRRSEFARVLFCYGFGERQPALGLKVQDVVQELRLVAEAILPAFNRYQGAEAIGGASALYVCRPTRRTWPALRDATARADPRIYTRGEGAEEAALPALPPAAARALEGQAGDRGDLGLTVVGDGLPDGLRGRRPALALGAYLRDVGTAQGRPPFTAAPHDGVVVVNLWPHHGAYLPRLLLTAAAARLVVATPSQTLEDAGLDPADPLARLLAAAWRLHVHARRRGSAPAVLVAERTGPPADDPVGFVLRYLVDHCHAALGNAWREALIAGAAVAGRRVSKNQARQAIAAGPLGAQLHSHLAELPVALLRVLVTDVGRTVEELRASASGA